MQSRVQHQGFGIYKEGQGIQIPLARGNKYLNEYFVKSAPIGAYKCFLNADVWHNLWHPALGQEIFCQ